jgi:hypothetical protein
MIEPSGDRRAEPGEEKPESRGWETRVCATQLFVYPVSLYTNNTNNATCTYPSSRSR